MCQSGQEIPLAWEPVAGAAGYLVQVARDLSFQKLHQMKNVTETQLSLRVGDKGLYVWRVASRDAEGIPGEFGFARRIFCEIQPPQELLLSPESNATVIFGGTGAKVLFSWQSAGSVAAYRLVLARAPQLLEKPATDLKTREQHVELAGLAEGRYYWGVYADEEPPRPIFLNPRELTVKRAPKAKLKAPKSFSDWGGTK